jgi:hypothetical protein
VDSAIPRKYVCGNDYASAVAGAASDSVAGAEGAVEAPDLFLQNIIEFQIRPSINT